MGFKGYTFHGHDCGSFTFESVREKTDNLGSDQVRHKPACTSTEDE